MLLSPGQQAASIPALASSVATAVSWSPDAESYLELLGSFVKIERELANFPAELRTNSALLSYLPAGAVVYGTVPNPGLTIGRALSLAEEQSAQNATFGAWWNSETGRLLRQMADRVQSVNPLLGDEIVFCASLAPGIDEPVPMVMARVQPGKRAELSSALEGLFAAAGEAPAIVFGFRRPGGRFKLAVAPGVGASLTWGRAPAPRLRQPSASGTGAAWAGSSRWMRLQWSRWRPETTPRRSSSPA